jgi:hypothetical protein
VTWEVVCVPMKEGGLSSVWNCDFNKCNFKNCVFEIAIFKIAKVFGKTC